MLRNRKENEQMKRKIIKIDEERCIGCGACAEACQEGAIAMVDGKARLMRDDYCDGLGNCLPACPVDAISFEEREAAPFDEAAVKAAQATAAKAKRPVSAGSVAEKEPEQPLACGCPGSHSRILTPRDNKPAASRSFLEGGALSQWPVQLKLAPVNAPYFQNAKLLVAADCTAFARADFHERFIRGKITLIGCPKLDNVDYSEKLTQILLQNEIQSITVVRMQVPCCGGIVAAVQKALQQSGKWIPWQVVTLSPEGDILD